MTIANLENKQKFFETLNERQRRHFVAIEAMQLGHGGIKAVSEAFGVHRETVGLAIVEVQGSITLASSRVRQAGGGRKKKLNEEPGIAASFEQSIIPFTGGSPQHPGMVWTALRPKEVQSRLALSGFAVSLYIAMQLLLTSGLRRRSYLKSATMGPSHPDRDAQFQKIADLRDEFLCQGFPVLSIDTKKKELLGNFHREGHYYDTSARKVNDHDFESFAEGKLVPHGIYDLSKNKGYITLGTSKDTSAFVCDNIATIWEQEMHRQYPGEDWLLLLCDGGGSNNARHYIVKQDLCLLAKRIQMNILVAHYPPYCSKYNPIEHRLFAHLHHAWSGAVLSDVQTAKELAEKTSTKTGLSVSVYINRNTYETNRIVDYRFKSNTSQIIDFDEKLPQWNYSIKCSNVGLIF
jgi:hypothetical protein